MGANKYQVKVGKKAKINVEWNDNPINYSHEAKKNIISVMADRYGIPKESVKVSFNAVKLNELGEQINVSSEVINNIQDPKFQLKLFNDYIIENKIESPESEGQFYWYAHEARKWCKRNRGQALLVSLARDKLERDEWLSLSYLDLASALRHVWQRRRSAPGHSWLGLYISAITSGVLGININRLRDTTIREIDAYLGRG